MADLKLFMQQFISNSINEYSRGRITKYFIEILNLKPVDPKWRIIIDIYLANHLKLEKWYFTKKVCCIRKSKYRTKDKLILVEA